MADTVGTLAMIASILLNISPFRDVYDIHRTRSVTERSILPYCMMMVDGANWILFAILIDDTFPIGVTNTVGAFCGTVYASVYLRNCWHDKRDGVRRRAWLTFIGALGVIAAMITASVVISVIWSTKTATDHLGYVIDLFNMLLYGSPLSLAWKVLRTRSTSGMYLPLSLTIVAASALWSSYGVLTQDLFVVVPQSVGLLAGLAQLALFIRFGVADNNSPSLLFDDSAPDIADSNSTDLGDQEGGGKSEASPSPSGLPHGDDSGGNGKPKRPSEGGSTNDQMRQPLL